MLADNFDTKRLSVIHTGGTTGRALAIYVDRAALQRNYAFFEQLKRWTGARPGAKVATFAGRPIVPTTQRSPPFWRRNFASDQVLFSSYHLSPDSLEAYVKGLEATGPELIDSYPSSIEPIARHILARGGAELDLDAVITSSETLFPETRALLEEAFGCRTFDYYGSAEMVAFAAQCEEGRYHPNPDYGFVEILREDGTAADVEEEGEIVATGFINEVMPLIRYRTGDLAAWRTERCPCNRPYPVMSPPVGRLDDVVVTPEGRRVGRLDPIFKAVGTLHEARIIQTHLERIGVEIVPGPDLHAKDESALIEELGHRLGRTMAIEVVRVESIPRTGRGKLRTVISPFT